jgi:multidrug efflux pump subunit AcrA (membrane-fusion protein)
MATTLKKLFLYFLCIICIAGFTMYVLNQTSSASDTPTESITLSKGTVTTIANVSGKTEATDDAALGFPQAGVVREIMKKEGESVIKGEIIASLKMLLLQNITLHSMILHIKMLQKESSYVVRKKRLAKLPT